MSRKCPASKLKVHDFPDFPLIQFTLIHIILLNLVKKLLKKNFVQNKIYIFFFIYTTGYMKIEKAISKKLIGEEEYHVGMGKK